MIKVPKKTLGYVKDRTAVLINARKRRVRRIDESTRLGILNHLPPKWFDKVEEAKDHIQKLEEICQELHRLRKERSQQENKPSLPIVQKKIDDRLEHANGLMRECEVVLLNLEKDQNEQEAEYRMKQNAKMALTINLTKIGREIKVIQANTRSNISNSTSYGSTQYKQPTQQQTQFEQQMQRVNNDNFELEYFEMIAKERGERIAQLDSKMQKVAEIFREMNRLVIEQGTLLDRIDFNIDQTYARTKQAKQELQKANEIRAPSSRAQYCICLLITLNVVFVVILILKFTIFKK